MSHFVELDSGFDQCAPRLLVLAVGDRVVVRAERIRQHDDADALILEIVEIVDQVFSGYEVGGDDDEFLLDSLDEHSERHEDLIGSATAGFAWDRRPPRALVRRSSRRSSPRVHLPNCGVPGERKSGSSLSSVVDLHDPLPQLGEFIDLGMVLDEGVDGVRPVVCPVVVERQGQISHHRSHRDDIQVPEVLSRS